MDSENKAAYNKILIIIVIKLTKSFIFKLVLGQFLLFSCSLIMPLNRNARFPVRLKRMYK